MPVVAKAARKHGENLLDDGTSALRRFMAGIGSFASSPKSTRLMRSFPRDDPRFALSPTLENVEYIGTSCYKAYRKLASGAGESFHGRRSWTLRLDLGAETLEHDRGQQKVRLRETGAKLTTGAVDV